MAFSVFTVVALAFMCMQLPSVRAINCTIDIGVDKYLHESREDFLSIDLDCSLIGSHWQTFDFANPGVIAMAKALSPAILRLGGTACDYVVFNQTFNTSFAHHSKTKARSSQTKLNSVLTIKDWDKLMQFTHTSNLTLLYDANVMRRDSKGNWDPANFKTFLKYNQDSNNRNLMFELGNEPNNYPAHFNLTITAAQLAQDFGSMKKVLDTYTLYKDKLIVGADVGNPYLRNGLQLDPATYIHDFFKAAHSTIDALTWHQYYLKGSTARVNDFINATLMDDFQKQVDIVNSIIEDVLEPGAKFPVWMGETSSAYNSGAVNISNRYVAGFLWMDKLGVAARSGYDVVIRQTFYGGWYSLIDTHLQPLPDYWLSLLYKRLVGPRSLSVNVTQGQGQVRAYASCTNVKNGFRRGAVTLYAMNLDKDSTVTISTSLDTSVILAYNLEPTSGTLTSPYVNINGKRMELINNALPEILPRWTNAIVLKPLTFGFFVINNANAAAC